MRELQGNHAVVSADDAEAVVFVDGEGLVVGIVGEGEEAGGGFLQAFGVEASSVGEEVDAVAYEGVGFGVDKDGGCFGDGGLHAVAARADDFEAGGVAAGEEAAHGVEGEFHAADGGRPVVGFDAAAARARHVEMVYADGFGVFGRERQGFGRLVEPCVRLPCQSFNFSCCFRFQRTWFPCF